MSKSKQVYCRKCTYYRNEWCDYKFDSPDPDMARNCRYYKSKTNADRIRGMTDEELANWISEHDMICTMQGCLTRQGYLDWLKQEVQI